MDAAGFLGGLLRRMERTALAGCLLGAVGAAAAGWLAEWALGTDPLWFLSPPHWPALMVAGGLAGTIGGLGVFHYRLNRLLREIGRD